MINRKEEFEDARRLLRSDIEMQVETIAKEFDISEKVLLKLGDYCATRKWFQWRQKDFTQIIEEMVELVNRDITQKEIDATALLCMDVDLTDATMSLAEGASESVLVDMHKTFGGRGDLETASIVNSIRERRFKVK